MHFSRTRTLLLSALLFSSIAGACAAPSLKGGAESAAKLGPGSKSESWTANPQGPQGQPPQRSAHKPKTFPEHKPALGIATTMKGDPDPKAMLKESHLIASTCEKAKTEDIDARLKEMREAVAASYKTWHDGQPQCWEDMRQNYLWQKQMEKEAARGAMWGDAIGDAFGVGGLGLSGVGQGGGGRGEGIGLGSVGTIGRAAGTQSSVGYGSAGAAKAGKYSGTNNQVATVDEADIVKTDGRYVYFAANGALRIVEAMNPRVVSITKLPGQTRELFVEGDRVVIYTSIGNVRAPCTYGYDCTFGGDGSSTKISVLDIKDRANPRMKREIALSGSLIAARRIGNTVHTVTADGDTGNPGYETWPDNFEMCGTPEAKVREKFNKMKADNERKIRAKTTNFPSITENGKSTPMCGGGLYQTAMRDGQAFTSVVSFDLTDDATAPTNATMQSRPGAVFASQNALYLSVVHQKAGQANGRWYSYYAPSVSEVSEIHKFQIGASPKSTKYIGSGTVPGHVLNQFAMDEWYGYLRVATTKGRVPDPKVESAVSILAETEGGALTRVGAIEKIAPGEDIRAVRFDDDRGYVVTFKKTDPLFVIDTFEPTRPKILGELKIPGFSTYIHRIDPDHLMSIGFDANDHGDFAYFDGVILQMFDVKKPTEPKLIHKEKIGTRGSSSGAATDHLAFNYFASEGLLAIPMTICEGGSDGVHGNDLAFSGLLVYDVDTERGFTRLGGVDHGKKGVNCNTWWSNANSAVKRSVFLDDLVYSIATDKVKVQKMSRFGTDVADLSMME
jgi:hypothetical protein